MISQSSNSSSSSEDSGHKATEEDIGPPSKKRPSYVKYKVFEFDISVSNVEVDIPSDVAQDLPLEVNLQRIKEYLPPSPRRKRDTGNVVYYMNHQNQIAFHLFTSQEACSSHGKYSQKLRATMTDRARHSGYITLPGPGNLRAAEVYNGGP